MNRYKQTAQKLAKFLNEELRMPPARVNKAMDLLREHIPQVMWDIPEEQNADTETQRSKTESQNLAELDATSRLGFEIEMLRKEAAERDRKIAELENTEYRLASQLSAATEMMVSDHTLLHNPGEYQVVFGELAHTRKQLAQAVELLQEAKCTCPPLAHLKEVCAFLAAYDAAHPRL